MGHLFICTQLVCFCGPPNNTTTLKWKSVGLELKAIKPRSHELDFLTSVYCVLVDFK